MGLTYSDFRRNYYNQVCRRLDRQFNANLYSNYSQLRPYSDYNFYKRPYFRDQPYQQQSAYPYSNYGCELNNETLCLEEVLHRTGRNWGRNWGRGIQSSHLYLSSMPSAAKQTTQAKQASSTGNLKRKVPSCISAAKIHPFIRAQNISDIRSEASVFKDIYFPPHSKVFGQPNCSFLKDFSKKLPVKWERTKMISYHKGLANQFVLDQHGKPVRDYCGLTERYFSVGDIFQGSLGSCFFLAAILGLTRNSELFSHVMPIENASQSNISKGAFNFRFWRLGKWYDLVVDDYLVCDAAHNILFTRNLSFPNEYWMCLVEKAFAKYYYYIYLALNRHRH